MPQRSPIRPTSAELDVLRVLWQKRAATVREVHAALGSRTAYTTVLKTMQIMTDKGLVRRDQSQRSHVYYPNVDQAATQRTLAGDLLERAFGGSARQLVQAALSARKASRKNLDEIRTLLDEIERGKR